MTASHAPAATAGFYLRRVVHLAAVIDGTPADHALCGMNLQYGAIDTTADATCPECREVAERLAAATPAPAELEVPEYLRPALDAYGAALDAHGQTFDAEPACSCGRPFRTRRGVGLHVTAEAKRAEREYTAAAAIARNRHRTANLSSTERVAAQLGVPVEQVAARPAVVALAARRDEVTEPAAPRLTAVAVTRIARKATGTDLITSSAAGPDAVLVSQRYAVAGALTPGDTSARREARASRAAEALRAAGYAVAQEFDRLTVTLPEPAAEPVHYTREQIAERFREVDEFVLVLGPDDTAYDPETGDTLLGGVTVRYARGEFPGPAYTATIEQPEPAVDDDPREQPEPLEWSAIAGRPEPAGLELLGD